jgi:hypothetical protein
MQKAAQAVGNRVATAMAQELKQLQDLTLIECGLQLNTVDGMACLEAIGRLTRLTYLNLHDNPGITQQGGWSAGWMQLADLTCLQCLQLRNCGLQLDTAEGMACLEAIGRLSQLTYLELAGNGQVTRQGWMQLTGLSRLQVFADYVLDEEMRKEFWAVVRLQQQHQHHQLCGCQHNRRKWWLMQAMTYCARSLCLGSAVVRGRQL